MRQLKILMLLFWKFPIENKHFRRLFDLLESTITPRVLHSPLTHYVGSYIKNFVQYFRRPHKIVIPPGSTAFLPAHTGPRVRQVFLPGSFSPMGEVFPAADEGSLSLPMAAWLECGETSQTRSNHECDYDSYLLCVLDSIVYGLPGELSLRIYCHIVITLYHAELFKSSA